MCLSISPSKADNHFDEYAVKAAFIFNFAKLTDWPNKDANSILICSISTSHIGEKLLSLNGKYINGKPIKVVRLNTTDTITHCHILYMGPKIELTNKIKEIAESNSILTIGESNNFLKSGGIINFQKVEDKISFTINVNAAKKSVVHLDGQLIKYGNIYKSNE